MERTNTTALIFFTGLLFFCACSNSSGNKANASDAKTISSAVKRNLYAVSLTVTITSIDNSRISGTFSGTFKADASDGGATANITSGSFNLPFLKN